MDQKQWQRGGEIVDVFIAMAHSTFSLRFAVPSAIKSATSSTLLPLARLSTFSKPRSVPSATSLYTLAIALNILSFSANPPSASKVLAISSISRSHLYALGGMVVTLLIAFAVPGLKSSKCCFSSGRQPRFPVALPIFGPTWDVLRTAARFEPLGETEARSSGPENFIDLALGSGDNAFCSRKGISRRYDRENVVCRIAQLDIVRHEFDTVAASTILSCLARRVSASIIHAYCRAIPTPMSPMDKMPIANEDLEKVGPVCKEPSREPILPGYRPKRLPQKRLGQASKPSTSETPQPLPSPRRPFFLGIRRYEASGLRARRREQPRWLRLANPAEIHSLTRRCSRMFLAGSSRLPALLQHQAEVRQSHRRAPLHSYMSTLPSTCFVPPAAEARNGFESTTCVETHTLSRGQ
ncbi:hypothetical protein KC325_g209 [Hortaea werneckii]|nr:hypothetical protein KC325_g209 [Hortaea werneckii]